MNFVRILSALALFFCFAAELSGQTPIKRLDGSSLTRAEIDQTRHSIFLKQYMLAVDIADAGEYLRF